MEVSLYKAIVRGRFISYQGSKLSMVTRGKAVSEDKGENTRSGPQFGSWLRVERTTRQRQSSSSNCREGGREDGKDKGRMDVETTASSPAEGLLEMGGEQGRPGLFFLSFRTLELFKGEAL